MTAADFTSHIYSEEKEPNPSKKKFIPFFRVKHCDAIPENKNSESIVTEAILAIPNATSSST